MKIQYLFPLFLLVLVVFLSGCTGNNGGTIIPPTGKPYIKEVDPVEDFAYPDDDIRILITATNPTGINFSGKILLQTDNNECFGFHTIYEEGFENTIGKLEDISIGNKRTNSIVVTISIPRSLSDECITTHKLTVFLLQDKDSIFDSKTFNFPLVSR